MPAAVSVLASRVEPKSSHLTEDYIQPFLQHDFDPVDHLNSVLPALTQSNTPRAVPRAPQNKGASLPELSSQLQSTLSQLNANSVRLSNALTQLTDEIIRSGGRLAYEVEVLRGETLGLTDSLENGLKKDIEVFVPHKHGIAGEAEGKGGTGEGEPDSVVPNNSNTEPDYLERLRSLTTVRARLDSVIKVFGDAMQWPVAPSETTSSLISISSPDSSEEARLREEKAKAFADNLRVEMNELLTISNDFSAIEAATAKLSDLRNLAEVWKGTAEEKPRSKLIDALQKLVDERQKALERTNNARRQTSSPARDVDLRYGNHDTAPGSYGFLQNLRHLKNDVYLE